MLAIMPAKKTPYQPMPILGNPDFIFEKPRQIVPKYAQPNADIKANKDLELVVGFLKRYVSNTRTLASYRSELERLMHWSWHVKKQSILDHDENDLVDYLEFAKAPPRHWIGTAPAKRFVENKSGKLIPNPNWRPYVAKLRKKELTDRHAALKTSVDENIKRPGPDISDHNPTPATLIATRRVLSALYKHLLAKESVSKDYVKLMPQTRDITGVDQTANQVMLLTNLQWKYVIDFATELADKAKSKQRQHERTLFVMTMLFLMYLRISELVWDDLSEPVMSDFFQDGDGNWWLNVFGKGDKPRKIAVSDEMLDAISRYRLSRDLPAYPSRSERDIPLLAVIRDDSASFKDKPYYKDPKKKKEWYKYAPVTSTRAVRKMVQNHFDYSFNRMLSSKRIKPHEAESLKEATVHWLRHTGISVDVKERDPRHVQIDAGHASMATTNRYIDIEDKARHLSAKKKGVR